MVFDVQEQVLRATSCTDSIRLVTSMVKISACSSPGFLLRCCSLAVFLALLFVVHQGMQGLRASGSECKQGFLKFLYNAMGGVRKGMCIFNWSEALTGQVRVACLAAFFRLGFYNVRDPQV